MKEVVGRRVSETRVEVAEMMQPHHANPAGNVHGGQIMKMIDDAAGVVAIRHARSNVVTASIDRLDFHAPVYVGNLVVLKASMNCVGRSSMEVGVRVEAEDLRTGGVRHTASAYLTFVALGEEVRTRPVPPLVLETEDDRRRHEAGRRRREERARMREVLHETGLLKPPGAACPPPQPAGLGAPGGGRGGGAGAAGEHPLDLGSEGLDSAPRRPPQ